MTRTFSMIGSLLLLLWTGTAYAVAPQSITFRYQHFLFTINPAAQPSWTAVKDSWTWDGMPVEPRPEWRVDGDILPNLPTGVLRTERRGWNKENVRTTLQSVIGKALDRTAGSVTIDRDPSGTITFDGVGLTGRSVDIGSLTDLTMTALEMGVSDITIPVTVTQPTVTVNDPELQAMGIREVVTVGESNFAGSPVNRRHNIGVGLRRFNGQVVPQGSTFSFNAILGRVDNTTGYRKELVIKGDRTEPDYGGGLCQISSTAYRGIWEYGFPIVKRKNHSYSVHYYSPAGTDATVYPGAVDMSFINDSPGALLIQAHQQNDRAYFVYYGTRDVRTASIHGPFVLSTSPPPPDKQEFTTDLAPGERKKLNERVPGMSVIWFRTVQKDGKEIVESVPSIYEARPLFYAVGATTAAAPSWINQGPSTQQEASSSSSSKPGFTRPSRRR